MARCAAAICCKDRPFEGPGGERSPQAALVCCKTDGNIFLIVLNIEGSRAAGKSTVRLLSRSKAASLARRAVVSVA